MPKLILATRNKKKIIEIKEAMDRVCAGWEVVGLNDLTSERMRAPIIDIEETGSTFEENALIKARAVQLLCRGRPLWVPLSSGVLNSEGQAQGPAPTLCLLNPEGDI